MTYYKEGYYYLVSKETGEWKKVYLKKQQAKVLFDLFGQLGFSEITYEQYA